VAISFRMKASVLAQRVRALVLAAVCVGGVAVVRTVAPGFEPGFSGRAILRARFNGKESFLSPAKAGSHFERHPVTHR